MTSYVNSVINSEIELLFKDYSLHYLNVPDTVFQFKFFNCFYFDIKDTAVKNIKHNSKSLNSYHNKYYSSDVNGDGKLLLKNAVSDFKCDYVLLINRFEIINPNSEFSLHIEVLDSSLNRVYGNKNEIERDISKTMYGDMLKYYIRFSCKGMIAKVKKYLNDKN